MKRLLKTALVLLVLVASCFAGELRTTVKYISASAIYIDAGRAAGLEIGDKVRVIRGEKLIAILEVSFVADNSASCQLLESTGIIQPGDVAIAQVEESILPEDTGRVVEPQVTPAQTATSRPVRPANQLTGRISADVTLQDDREEFNYDYTQPSLRVRAALNRIAGSHYRFAVNLRVRKTYRDRETTRATTSASSSRIYEAALTYDNPDDAFSYGAGRMLVRALRGIGYLDGAMLRYRAGSSFSTGLFGGTEPDLENTDFQSDVVKAGAFATYKNRLRKGGRFAATLSLAGAYENGDVNREFICQQVSYNYGARFRIYESTELNINRDWLKDAEGSSLKLASFLLNARYAVSRALAFSLSYDNRTNYYTLGSRSVPDSLFDDALRQGWRAGANLRITDRISGELGAGLRTTEGDAEDTRSGRIRLSIVDLLESRANLSVRVRAYSSEYSSGYQPSVTLSRPLFRSLRASLEVGANNYDLELTGETVEQNWIRLMFDANFSRSLYASLDAEAARGSGRDTNILSLGLGYRF
jgi:hypothetical protein